MTTFASLYQRFQEIGDFSTWKKESEVKKRERERERKAKKPEPIQRVILDKH